MRLKDKIAIVTGAGRGLGRGIALKLCQEGAKIVVADVVTASAQAVADEIMEAGGSAVGFAVDVTNAASVDQMYEAAKARFGGVDILVNNAGITRDATIHKLSDADWDAVIAVNLTGTFYCLRKAAQEMRERGYGRIVNISSVVWMGNFGQANYAASKAGVVGLTKTAARELAKYGVTVNAVCPGFIETDMTRAMPRPVWDATVAKIWLGRAGVPEDVAKVVAFLASDDAAYVTGEAITVNGGLSL